MRGSHTLGARGTPHPSRPFGASHPLPPGESEVSAASSANVLIQFSNSGRKITLSRRDASELYGFRFAQNRGRREDRVRAAPAVSCAKVQKQNAHEHTGSAEAVRPSL